MVATWLQPWLAQGHHCGGLPPPLATSAQRRQPQPARRVYLMSLHHIMSQTKGEDLMEL